MLIVWALFLCYLNTHVLGDDDDDDNDDDGNGFSFPNATDPEDANLVFTMGNTMDIEWDSPFDNVDLGFVAQGSSTFISLIQNSTDDEFDWSVNVNNSGSSSPYYYLYIQNADNYKQYYYSAKFRVNEAANAASSSAGSSTTVFTSPTIQVIHSTIGAQTVTVTKAITLSPPTAESSTTARSRVHTSGSASASAGSATSTGDSGYVKHGLNQGAKIGIGVGVPLGIMALAGLAFLALCLRRRRGSVVTKMGNGDGLGIEQIPMAHASDNVGIAQAEGYRDQPLAKLAITGAGPTPDISMQSGSLTVELPSSTHRMGGQHGFPQELNRS